MSQVSVVVISKDEASLDETLASLAQQCRETGAECVVVDASSGRLDHIRLAHPWVHWHDYVGPTERSVTIPHQRNFAVKAAKGDVIAFTDAGSLPASNWVSSLVAPILESVAVATAGPVRPRAKSAFGTVNDLPCGAPVRHTVTCNLAFSRALYERVGGFDERFDYGSDIEFGWRIQDAGETVVAVPDAVVAVDWGDRRRQLHRAVRYGEAKVRQFRLCPSQRGRILRESPEVVVYPLLFATTPLALIAAALTRRWALVAPWAVGFAAILGRDLSRRRPPGAMLDHIAVAIGIIRALLHRSAAEIREGPLMDR